MVLAAAAELSALSKSQVYRSKTEATLKSMLVDARGLKPALQPDNPVGGKESGSIVVHFLTAPLVSLLILYLYSRRTHFCCVGGVSGSGHGSLYVSSGELLGTEV